jgi:hypothetical protein
VPTAIPAASVRPKSGNSSHSSNSRNSTDSSHSTNPTYSTDTKPSRSIRRIAALALAVPMAATMLVAEAPVVAASASDCSSHVSLTRPPDSIRVLKVRSGRIVVVPFKKYVVTVMGKEWPSYLPQAVIEAGAVAVKQYAWYHMVYSSRAANGRCFDVKDGTGDQLYKPQRARVRPDHYRAVDATWGVTLRKDGRFFMTGYRRGEKVRCGRDATGWKLYARSATQCARNGKGWREILRIYYGPGLTLVGGGSSSASAASSLLAPTSNQSVSTDSIRLTNGRWVDPADPAAADAVDTSHNASQPDVVAANTAGGVAFGGTSNGVAALLDEESPTVL